MKILCLDLETTVQRHEGQIDNSPFNSLNKIVSAHYMWVGCYKVTNLVFNHNEKEIPDDPEPLRNALKKADMIIAHNAKFDLQWLSEAGFEMNLRVNDERQAVYDTMIAEYIFSRGQRRELSLKKIAERRNVPTQKKSDLVDDLFKSGTGFEAMPLATVIEYAEADVKSTAEIYLSQQEELEKHPGLKPTFKLMNEMLIFLLEIENNGISIDSDALSRVETQFLAEKEATEIVLNDIIRDVMGDRPINLNSGQDMTKVIYSREIPDREKHRQTFNIGVDARGRPLRPPRMKPSHFVDAVRKTSRVVQRQIATHCSTCDSLGKIQKVKVDGTPWKNLTKCPDCNGMGALYYDNGKIAGLKLSPLDPSYASINGFKTDKQTISLLIKYAEKKNNLVAVEFLTKSMRLNALNTYLNTFINGIKNNTRKDGRLHSSFNQCVTATGRLSSSNINVQNFPRSNTFPVRQCFVSRFEGGQIWEADYSGLEFRVCGEISRDQQIIDDVKEGKDIHSQTASIIHRIPLEEVTKELRSSCKKFTFLPIYGGMAMGEEDHVKEYINSFFNVYPGVKRWHDSLVKEVLEEPHVITTPSGREFRWENPRRIANGRVSNHTQCVNYPCQSLATADLVPLACIKILRIFKDLKLKSKLILSVHDSIVIDVHPDDFNNMDHYITISMRDMKDDMKARWNHDQIIPLDIEIAKGKNWMVIQ